MENIGGLQIGEAVDYVRELIQTDSEMMSHMYITGHSLGGYLAQYVQSEMIDENLPWVESFAVTFNAPGFSPSINFADIAHQAKVIKKRANDKLKKYDDLIVNHRINLDIISFFGDDLGTVYTYSTVEGSMNPLYYHSLDRFKEVNLK
ncbi:Mbeg1-like protein [Viridibacillus soli]|uniref:Mbeg1-like protein n=1 Tax=Viridibacillus soli TaxID=2798301 RepID=UPI002D7F6BDA|nr:Mbeg1-like protein [Viridibacillus soli]